MTEDIQQIPVPVRDYPHWRVRVKPDVYRPDRLSSLEQCIDLTQKSQVQLRGWFYPHFSQRAGEFQLGSNWIASWSDFMGHIEYWRLYQSGQFIHLFAVQESVLTEWRDQLRGHLISELSQRDREASANTAGYLSIDNFIFTVTEIFEFATRLATKASFGSGLSISIQINGIKNYALSYSSDRVMFHRYATTLNVLENAWDYRIHELVADPARAALAAVQWFFERFGWMKQPYEIFKQQQTNFIEGRW